ncbi:ABC transporter permease [Aminobacter sp. AP02]|uniref:ABC transporter permease n=1 Tax=Aminobacter sp. AP02 TaxID=2135737 RepID=UPI000D6B29F8|nr:ABC transporter permease [Aminobacter sp. AP02]PWK63036.1 peptide/nickel transport system permease protein [Aminobacter sp. AP02]
MRNVFSAPVSTELLSELPRRRSAVLRFAMDEPLGALGLVVIVASVLLTLFAPLIAPYDPLANDYGAAVQAPSALHWLGTDSFGRDIFSRVLYGGRTALLIGVTASFIGCTIGALLGIGSAYFGGWMDLILERFMEILLAIPITVLALVLVSTLGRDMMLGIDVNLVFAIALPIIPKMARVARSQALSMRRMSYVDAARTLGFGHFRIIALHMAPNIFGPYIVMLTAFVSQAILIEASLSYLGLGVVEPTPSWGLMLAGNAFNTAMTAPWIVIFPGLAIAIVIFAFSMFGDALRDLLDPKSNRDR